jgi:hypothetical protein
MLTSTSLLIQQLIDSGKVKPNLETGEIIGLRGNALKIRVDGSGYCTVSLARNHLPVHRLVAYTAFGERALQAGSIISHRDGNRRNNAAANLEVRPAAGQRNRPALRRVQLGWGVTPSGGKMIAAFASRELAEEYAAWKHADGAAVLPLR